MKAEIWLAAIWPMIYESCYLIGCYLPMWPIRVQKQKAAMSEDRADQLAAELLEKDAKLEDVRTSLEEVSLRLEKSVKERSQSAAENTALKTWVDVSWNWK